MKAVSKPSENKSVLLDVYNTQVATMFLNKGFNVDVFTSIATQTVYHYDYLVYTGGSDLCPSLYKNTRHPDTKPSKGRTDASSSMYEKHVPWRGYIGVGRGAQFLNVMSGGTIIQSVHGHDTGGHDIMVAAQDRLIRTDSKHHQQAVLPNDAELIAYCVGVGNRHKEQGGGKAILPKSYFEPEIWYHKNTASLCFQGHPENPKFPNMNVLFWELIEQYLNNEEEE